MMCESDGRVYGCSGNGWQRQDQDTLEAPTEACYKELNRGPRLIDPGGTVHDQVEDNNSWERTAAVQGAGRCEGNGWEARGEGG
jgi:hypothetical protein